jgi:DNA-binding winged helix-turn-helix (wHTH) protein
MEVGLPTPFRFGAFEVDPEAGEIRKNGVLVRLPPQPFRLLLLLASRSGRVVSREDIKKQLWGEETFVDFDQGVNFSVRQIRDALGDTAEGSRYIQTLPRRGYKFLLPVEPIGPAPPPTTESGTPAPDASRRGMTDVNLHVALWENIAEIRLAEERRKARRRKLVMALAALALLLMGLFALKALL